MYSFLPPVTEDQIAHAKEVWHWDHHRVCPHHGLRVVKSGCENWSCAFAPNDHRGHDSRLLAWSAGHRIVKLQSLTSPDHSSGDDKASVEFSMSCGELVHSLAFGRCANTSNRLRWKRQCLNRDLLILATGHTSGRIKLWNCESGKLLLDILDHKDVVHDLDFSREGSLCLASASRDGTVKLWEFDDNGDANMYLTLRPNSKHVFSCKWSPDKKHVAATGTFKTAVLFRVKGRTVLGRHKLEMQGLDGDGGEWREGHDHDVTHCDFSPDGALLATASLDTRVILWDVYQRTMLAKLGHLLPSPRPIYAGGANGHYVYSVKFSSDGSQLATVAEDGYLRVWRMPDLTNPVAIATIKDARCCSFAADGRHVAVGTVRGSVVVVETPEPYLARLKHLCRLTIRRRCDADQVLKLPLPGSMRKYLLYGEVVCLDDILAP